MRQCKIVAQNGPLTQNIETECIKSTIRNGSNVLHTPLAVCQGQTIYQPRMKADIDMSSRD